MSDPETTHEAVQVNDLGQWGVLRIIRQPGREEFRKLVIGPPVHPMDELTARRLATDMQKLHRRR